MLRYKANEMDLTKIKCNSVDFIDLNQDVMQNLCDKFTIENGLKQGDALSS
jgi:hypothetical protein